MASRPAPGTWIAFLRGMNLGGRRLTNDELRLAVEACGCSHVRTYQASGNVVVADGRREDELTVDLEDGLAAALGYPVPVFLRSASEVREIAATEPFSPADTTGSGKPQVIFLRRQLPADGLRQIEELIPVGDRMVVANREIHWLPAAGLAESSLELRHLDAITGGTTIRTHGTVRRLASRFLAP